MVGRWLPGGGRATAGVWTAQGKQSRAGDGWSLDLWRREGGKAEGRKGLRSVEDEGLQSDESLRSAEEEGM